MRIYEAFGLSENPFSTTPNPRFAYQSKEHQLALVKILYSIQERMGLFVLRGEIGTGKSTLARFLVQSLGDDPAYHVAYFDELPMRTEAGFLRAINGGLGLPTPFKTEAIKNELLSFLLRMRQENKTVVLMIDEGQKILSANLHTIHGLLNRQSAEHQLLQIVLFAQPNFSNKVEQMPQLKSRITGAAYLEPLTFEESIELLRYRVDQVTERTDAFDDIFPTEEVKNGIYKAAGGVPRDLCVLCNAALVNAYGLRETCVTPGALDAAVRDFREIKFGEQQEARLGG